MNTFSIEYHHEIISVTSDDKYRLSYPDGRWLLMAKRQNDTGTVSIFNDSTNYGTASVWAIESKSEGPDWLNREQLQVIGELALRKELEAQRKQPASQD